MSGSLGTPSPPLRPHSKVVSFGSYVEVFEYQVGDCIVPSEPALVQLRPTSLLDVVGTTCWKIHGASREDVAPGFSLRNEHDPVPALRDHPVQDAEDFDFTLDDEQDSDNDLGVSFFRWQEIAELADVFQFASANEVPFITFGLRNLPLGRRDFVSPDLSPSRLRELIWQLWQDEAHQFDDLVIHFVRPQPITELNCPGVIVLIVEICHEGTPPTLSPVLAMSCDRHNRPIDSPRAIYIPQTADEQGILSHISLSHLCAPDVFRQCQLYVAGQLVRPGVIPVPPGAAVKLVLSAKLQIFAQAATWFPDMERFAARVRALVRSGVFTHILQIHRCHHDDVSLPFRIADVFQPAAFKDAIERTCGHPVDSVFPIADRVLNAAYVDASARFHVIVFDDHAPDSPAFVAVTQVSSPDGSSSYRGHRVCLRDDFSTLEALHRALCQELQLDPRGHHQFVRHGHQVEDLDEVSHTDVLSHTVGPSLAAVPASSTEAPLIGADDQIDDSESVDTSDGMSLLQTAVARKKVVVLQHNRSPHRLEITADDEEVERCEIAMQLSGRFSAAVGWLDRKPSSSLYSNDMIEILIDLSRPFGFADVVLEVSSFSDEDIKPLFCTILRLPLPVWVALCWQSCLPSLASRPRMWSQFMLMDHPGSHIRVDAWLMVLFAKSLSTTLRCPLLVVWWLGAPLAFSVMFRLPLTWLTLALRFAGLMLWGLMILRWYLLVFKPLVSCPPLCATTGSSGTLAIWSLLAICSFWNFSRQLRRWSRFSSG